MSWIWPKLNIEEGNHCVSWAVSHPISHERCASRLDIKPYHPVDSLCGQLTSEDFQLGIVSIA